MKPPLTRNCPICRSMPLVYKAVTSKDQEYHVGCPDFVEVNDIDIWMAKVKWNREVNLYKRKVEADGRKRKNSRREVSG